MSRRDFTFRESVAVGIVMLLFAVLAFPLAYKITFSTAMSLVILGTTGYLIAGIEVWRRVRQRDLRWRHLRRQCSNCGYDLRATPNRCPECGTPAPPLGKGDADAT